MFGARPTREKLLRVEPPVVPLGVESRVVGEGVGAERVPGVSPSGLLIRLVGGNSSCGVGRSDDGPCPKTTP